jgi:2,6-dihydroxypseudooxynicotine hydrolase
MRQMTLIAERVKAPKTIVLEEQGDHCSHNLGPRVRVPMADWLVEQLRAR